MVCWYVGMLVEHSPAARDLQILLVFFQHPAWFISLLPIETRGLLLKYSNIVEICMCFLSRSLVTPLQRCVIMHEVVDELLRKLCHY